MISVPDHIYICNLLVAIKMAQRTVDPYDIYFEFNEFVNQILSQNKEISGDYDDDLVDNSALSD